MLVGGALGVVGRLRGGGAGQGGHCPPATYIRCVDVLGCLCPDGYPADTGALLMLVMPHHSLCQARVMQDHCLGSLQCDKHQELKTFQGIISVNAEMA